MTAVLARLRTWLAWTPPDCPYADCLACEMGWSPPCAYVGPVPWRVRAWRWLRSVGRCGQHGGRS